MEDRYEITFKTSLGKSKRLQVRNANLSLAKELITNAFVTLMSSCPLDPAEGTYTEIQKAQSVSVSAGRLF